MKDLGENRKGLYGEVSPAKEPKIVYREIDLPLKIIDGLNIKRDDMVDIHLKGRMSGFQDTKWTQRVSFEVREGEVKKTGKKGENIIAEA